MDGSVFLGKSHLPERLHPGLGKYEAAILRGYGAPLWHELPYREWDRVNERPSFLDVYNLNNGELVFTVIVWPSLLQGRAATLEVQRVRARRIFKAVEHAAPDLMGATTWEVDYAPVWHRGRQVWLREDMSAHESPEYPTPDDGGRVSVHDRL